MSIEENKPEGPTITADACQEPEEPKAPDKICPTCIPNESWTEPDWWDEVSPFLNERTCEYWANVSINSSGDTYVLSDLKGKDEAEFKKVLKTYIRSGVRKMLRHYDKLEADEIVCAAPPQQLRGRCKDISMIDYENWMDETKKAVIVGSEAGTVYESGYTTDEARQKAFDAGVARAERRLNPFSDVITNTRALELYARAADYWVYSSGESVLHVLITIPAFVFDQVPDAPKKAVVDTGKEEVELNAYKLRTQLAMVKQTFSYFSKFQSFFYQYEGGKLKQEIPQHGGGVEYRNLYLKHLDDRLDVFEDHLETLIEENDYTWRTWGFGKNKVTHIKFVFNKEDEWRPFDVDRVLVKAKGCDYVEMKKGIDTFKSRDNVKSQTIMGYIANIKEMSKELEGRETPPWLDWVVKYTFPEISVDYGISNLTTDPIGSCALKQVEQLDDFILNSVLSFQTAFAYQLNKQNCKMLSDLNLSDPMNPQSGEKEVDLSLTGEWGVSKAWEKFTDKLEMDYTKNTGPFYKWVKKTFTKKKKGSKKKNYFDEVIRMVSPCTWKDIALDALKCVMSGLDIKTVYLIFVKKTLANLAGEGLEIVLSSLPRDKYEKVMAIVEKEFAGMPMPWEYGYKPGQIPEKLLDSKARGKTEDIVNKMSTATEKQAEISRIKARLLELGINIEAEIDELDLSWTNQRKADKLEKDMKKEHEKSKNENYEEYWDSDTSSEERYAILEHQGQLDDIYEEEAMAGNIETAYQQQQAMKINWTQRKYDPIFKLHDESLKEEAKRQLGQYFVALMGLDQAKQNHQVQQGVVDAMEKQISDKPESTDPTAGTIDDEGTRKQWTGTTIDIGTFANPKKTSKDFIKIQKIEKVSNKWHVTQVLWETSAEKIENHKPKSKVKKERVLTIIHTGKENKKLRIAVRKDLCKLYTDFLVEKWLPREKEAAKKRTKSALEDEKGKLKELESTVKMHEDVINQQAYINKAAISASIGKTKNISQELAALADTKEIEKYVNFSSLKTALNKEIENARIVLTNNNKTIYKTDKMLEENQDYIAWKQLTPEQQAEVTEKQKELIASGIYTLEPGEEVVPGTLGKALGNVQKAFVAALIDAILKSATVMEIIRTFDRLPGSKLIMAFLATFKCPNTHLLWPPIDTFLNTLTFDPCGSGKTGMALPKVPELGSIKGWSIWKALRDALVYALKLTVEQVLMSILMKAAKILDSALCKAMGLPLELVRNAFSPDPKSFGEIVDEMICGKKNQDDKEKDNALAQVMKQAGAIPRTSTPPGASSPDNMRVSPPESDVVENLPESSFGESERDEYSNTNPNWQDIEPNSDQQNLGKYKDLSILISNIATKDELITAMTSLPEEQNVSFMENISNIVKVKMPEFAMAFAGVEETISFFTGCGNLFTPQQRAALRNQTGQPFSDYPIDSSTCLTNNQKEEWDQQRQKAFEEAGLHPAIANEYVDKLNNRAASDFADIVDAIIKSPEEQFQEALNKALNPPSDPDCKLPGVFDPYPGPTLNVLKSVTEGLFKRVQMAFVEDLLAYNWFERWFGDPPGILNTILADKYGFTLTLHNFINGNKFWRFMFTQEWALETIPTPETVAIVLKENLDGLSDVYEYPYDENKMLHLKDEESLLMEYNNGLEKNPFKSKIFMYEAIEKSSKNGEFRQNFDYKLKIRSKFFNKTFVVDKQVSLAEDELMTNIEPETYVGSDYKAKMFYNFIKFKYKSVFDIDLSVEKTISAFYAMNELIFDDFAKKLMVGKNGDMPEGFYYGMQDELITSDDTEYVGPDGEEYDYDEEEKVLGKSKTDNPRVHFLDPAEHGGTYSNPYKYIETVGECGGQRGWMKLARVIIPEMHCGEGETDFLYLNNLMKRISKVGGTIERHEKLDFDPDCVVEKAFDKIAAGETLAQLEGVVLATIRLHITDFVINAMPVLSNINLDFGKNYDEAISEYIMYKLEQACIEEVSFFSRSKWEGENYYMLFLEQTAQTVMRMIDNEEMERNEELDKAYKQIEGAIKTYPTVNLDDIDDGWMDGAMMMSGMLAGSALSLAIIMASGPVGAALMTASIVGVAPGTGMMFRFIKDAISLSMARWAMKLSIIRDNKSACRTMLKYLIRNQLSFYREEINLRMEPRPYIYDTAKYFIGASNVFQMGADRCIKAGISDIENPIGGGSIDNLTYGNVRDVVTTTGINPINFGTPWMGTNFLMVAQDHGAFYLERYVRVLTPDATMLNQSAGKLSDLQDAVLNRDESLRGVVNIEQFKTFLSKLNAIVAETNSANISDLLGDMIFRDVVRTGNEETEKMSDDEFGAVDDISMTGVKFGVRLCYVPPKNFEISNLKSSTGFTKREKSYFFESSFNYYATKFIFPVCSYEVDLPNARIEDYINSDENMNQNIKCLVDNLTKQPEFTLLFDKLFDLTKLPSILAIYSAINFLPSLGLGSEERNEEESIGDDGIGNTFNDTKTALRKLFVQCYKRDDFDPPDEDDEYDFVKDETRRALANMFRAVTYEDDVWFWQKRRLIDKPFDCDGNSCGNAFSKLFETKEKSNLQTEKRKKSEKQKEEDEKKKKEDEEYWKES